MNSIFDISQATQGMGLFDLIVMIVVGAVIGIAIGSMIASWLMAVVCRTILRHQATVSSCFAAYWLTFFASIGCGILLGIWQTIVFYGQTSELPELLPIWNMIVLTVLTTAASVMIYGLRIKDERARHLGIVRAIALFFVQPLVMIGLVCFIVFSADLVWKLRGMEPLGAMEWLRMQIAELRAQ